MVVINKKLKDLENKMQGKYLTETLLGEFLAAVYPNKEWLHDKKFEYEDLGEGVKKFNFRPDFCCHELKMCVEFDGADHYTKVNVIRADNNKDNILKDIGYTVIRVPYFLQLDKDSIEYLFDLDIDFNYNFKHGFVSKNVTLPASFCEQGIWKFKDFIFKLKTDGYENILSQIEGSLQDKVNSLGLPEGEAILNVIPTSMILDLGFKEHNYDTVDNANKVRSSLRNNWNCVMLESSQTLQNIEGVYDIEYNYNSEGNISGYCFKMFWNSEVIYYKFFVEDEDEDYVKMYVFVNEMLKYTATFNKEDVNLFNVTDIILDNTLVFKRVL